MICITILNAVLQHWSYYSLYYISVLGLLQRLCYNTYTYVLQLQCLLHDSAFCIILLISLCLYCRSFCIPVHVLHFSLQCVYYIICNTVLAYKPLQYLYMYYRICFISVIVGFALFQCLLYHSACMTMLVRAIIVLAHNSILQVLLYVDACCITMLA